MKTIMWDVDDVLNDFKFNWFHKNQQERKIKINNIFEDLINDVPYKILENDEEHYLKSIDDFRMFHFLSLLPNKEILYWFKNYGKLYNNIVVTSIPLKFFYISVKWTSKYFGKWIRSYNVVPSKRDNDGIYIYETKAEFIKNNFDIKKIDYYIDDSERNCKQVSELGIQTFCPKQPWNNGMDIKDILKELK